MVSKELAHLSHIDDLVPIDLEFLHLLILHTAKSILVKEELEELVILGKKDLHTISIPIFLFALPVDQLDPLNMLVDTSRDCLLSWKRIPLGVKGVLIIHQAIRRVINDYLPFRFLHTLHNA